MPLTFRILQVKFLQQIALFDVKNEGIFSNIRQLLASLFAFAGVLCLTLTSCDEAVLQTGKNSTSTGTSEKIQSFIKELT